MKSIRQEKIKALRKKRQAKMLRTRKRNQLGRSKAYKVLITEDLKMLRRTLFESERLNNNMRDLFRAIKYKFDLIPKAQRSRLGLALFFETSTGRVSSYNIPTSFIKDEGLFTSYINSAINQGFGFVEGGSDIFRRYARLNQNRFILYHLAPRGGSNIPEIKHGNKKAKNLIVNGFICHNFPSKNDNCLIEVFRWATGNKEKTSNEIRKILGFPKGKLNINHIPQLEKYFNTVAAVVVSTKGYITFEKKGEKNNITWANLKKFKAKVEMKDSVLYGDKHKAKFWIMIVDEHFSLISKRIFEKRCEITGQPLKRKDKKYLPRTEIIKHFEKIGYMNAEKKKKKKKKEDREKKYWFFDYETVFSKYGYLNAYSIACVCGRFENKKFVEEQRFFLLEENCSKKFVKWLLKNRNNKHDNILVGYNNSRFDNFLILDELLQLGMIGNKNLFSAANSILELKFNDFRCIDLCRFVMQSLSDACKNFKCDISKSTLDHKYFQDNFFTQNNFFKFVREKHYKEIKQYNLLDCLSLADLYFKVRNGFLKLAKLDINDYMTISQLAYSKWSSYVRGTVFPPKDYETWKFCRKAVYAGRSQIFKTGHFSGFNQSWDVKSLYPFVMLDCEFPIGREKKTDKYVSDKLGIYNVTILSQPKNKIIPLRKKGEPLNWNYEGEFDCVLTSVDIENLKDKKSKIIIKDGIYWERSSKNVFNGYLTPFKDEKNRQDRLMKENDDEYNQALREICKLAMNSLSGKVIQRIYESSTELITTTKELTKFLETHQDVEITTLNNVESIIIKGKKKEIRYNTRFAKPCHLGVFIYSYARTHMYKSVISRIKNKRGMDTDSVHTSIKVKNLYEYDDEGKPLRGYGRFFIGGEFGDFEAEINFKVRESYYVAPKCYGIFGKVKKKIRFKGVGPRDKLILISREDFDKLSIEDKYNYYNSLPPALCEQLYKKLTSGKDVNILCSQIQKIIIDKDGQDGHLCKLKQVFNYKIIKSTGEIIN